MVEAVTHFSSTQIELRIEVEGLEGDDLKRKQAHNENVARVDSALAAAISKSRTAFPDCRSVKLSQIKKMREEIQQRVLELLQERVVVAEDRVGILDSFETGLQTQINAAEKQLETTITAVKKSLNKAGVSVESQPAWPANDTAAEIQFNHQVNRSQPVRDAKAALEQAESRMGRLNTLRIQSDTAILRTHEELSAFVQQLCR